MESLNLTDLKHHLVLLLVEQCKHEMFMIKMEKMNMYLEGCTMDIWPVVASLIGLTEDSLHKSPDDPVTYDTISDEFTNTIYRLYEANITGKPEVKNRLIYDAIEEFLEFCMKKVENKSGKTIEIIGV